jgi:hypothetical protein
MESGALRMSEGLRTMILSNPFWRSVTWLVRLDMANGHVHRRRRRVAALADVALT